MMMSENDEQVEVEGLQEDEIDIREDENEDHAELEHLAGTGTADREEKDEDEEEEKVSSKDAEEDEYGKKVNVKIGKLTKRWREEERARLALQDRLEEANARADALEEKQAKAADDHYENSEKFIKERIKAAAEQEDWSEVMKGNDELRELDKGRYERAAKAKKAPAKAAPVANVNDVAPNAKAWIDANSDWFEEDSPDYDEALAGRAIRWSKKLQKDEMYDVNDPELYEKINKKLGLNKDDDEEEEEPAKFVDRGRRSINTGSRGPRRQKPAGKTLTARDKNLMRIFMLDPNSKTDQAEWIKRRNG